MKVFDVRGSGSVALVRLGFGEVDSAGDQLTGLGLWSGGWPADEGAEVVITDAAAAADPDLVLTALVRLHAAIADQDRPGRPHGAAADARRATT